MNILNKKEPILLFLGDLMILNLALWVSLFLRFGRVPDPGVFQSHFWPFLILSLVWTLSFFISGLYETHRVMIRNRLPEILIKTQLANTVFAIGFFYFFPVFEISPKTVLSVYVAISFAFLLVWRISALYLFISKRKSKALLIGGGPESQMLYSEVNSIARHNFEFVLHVNPEAFSSEQFQDDLIKKIDGEDIRIVVVDSSNEKIISFLPRFYGLIFSKVQFLDFHKLYGEVFYRLPLDLLSYRWFVQNINISRHGTYDALKRVMDIVISIPALIIFAPFVLFGAIALKIQDGREIFSVQTRVGRFGESVRLIKLRTMLFNDQGEWKEEGRQNEVTKLGSFLRNTRIDELPQIINVLKGDVSLIGPRPEFPQAVAEYAKAIPYYNARHIIKPGLSGWAQIYHDAHPHHGIDIEETKNKLSYDLYYIKNRSIVLDIMIALKTIKTFLSREGR